MSDLETNDFINDSTDALNLPKDSSLSAVRLEDSNEKETIKESIGKSLKMECDQTESCEVSDNESETSNKDPEWEDVLGSGSLMKLTVTKGKTNSRPQRLQICRIKFQCTLDDGTLVEKDDNFELQLGDCEVVQGLDLALGLMTVGEVCKLKLESRLAYGSKGLEPLIPPDAAVEYEVELLSVEDEEELEMISVSERRRRGNKKRERGNWWYGRGENQIAIQCYRRALDYLDEAEGGITAPLPDGEIEVTDAELQQLLEDRINVYNNMAAAQLKLGIHTAALQSLATVLRCQPENIKALFRKAKVHRANNDVEAAFNCLTTAIRLSPSNAEILKEMESLKSLKRIQKNSEKELARRMFNGLKTEKQSEKKATSSKLFMWLTVGASVAVGLAGLAAYRLKMV